MEQYEPERLSPAQLAAIRRSLTSGRAALTRSSLLRASAGGALVAGGLGALTSCDIPAAGKTQGGVSADDHSAKEKTVAFSNWTDYIDVDDSGKRHPTLGAFTKRTGIKVKYTEDINDNNEVFGKIKPQLAAGQDRPRHRRPHRLARRPADPPGVGPEAGPVQLLPHATRTSPTSSAAPTGTRAAPTRTPLQGISAVIACNKKTLDAVERMRPLLGPHDDRRQGLEYPAALPGEASVDAVAAD